MTASNTSPDGDMKASEIVGERTFFTLNHPKWDGGYPSFVIGDLDGELVSVDIESEFGTFAVWLEPEQARDLAGNINDAADRCEDA